MWPTSAAGRKPSGLRRGARATFSGHPALRSSMPRTFLLICDEIPRDIVLLDPGPQPLEVAKALRGLAGGGLWRAKQTVTQTPPVRLAEGVGDEVVSRWVGPLREAGAVIEVRTWWRYRPGKPPLPVD
ncbi:ribosomal protein L7/L12 [Streptomyces monashensis]